MTYAKLDSRVGKLETRVAEIEEGFGEIQLKLTRRVTGLEIWASRATAHMNGVGETLQLIAEHLGVRSAAIPEVHLATEAEIDAALEDGC
ncbi:hypothetical protein [Nocardia sp. NPDC051832]|uniref:hypothetical protein n=1 Tax=Nocardia sp. NPDC051832 TaxID=3155673 RepID=UPI00342E8BA1